mmetsp:Transcript_25768/g.46687  ORF Transcript_25768/g.46687 Transcript_25768/m.46687 type:complete len:92 (+) Transcript_25768:3104-3379(+)
MDPRVIHSKAGQLENRQFHKYQVTHSNFVPGEMHARDQRTQSYSKKKNVRNIENTQLGNKKQRTNKINCTQQLKLRYRETSMMWSCLHMII